MNKNIIIAILTIFLVIREYKHQQRIYNLRSYYIDDTLNALEKELLTNYDIKWLVDSGSYKIINL